MAYYKKKPKAQVRAARRASGLQGAAARWEGMDANQRRQAMRKAIEASPRTKLRKNVPPDA